MKKLFVVLVFVTLSGLLMAQTEATVDQTGSSVSPNTSKVNHADVWQSDAGPSNISGVTKTDVDQMAGSYNEAYINQLNRKSLIDVEQTAGTYNIADVTQSGNYDNHFWLNQSATSGYNNASLYLGQPGGGDIHGNDWDIDQQATGNNDVFITAQGNHIYSNWGIDLDQYASNGDNYAEIDMDGDWRRNVKIISYQTSMDNELYGLVRGQQVDINIYQDGLGVNFGDFEVQGNEVDLDVDQYSNFNNTLNSYQEGDASATVYQTSTLGSNTATINQFK